MALSVSLISLGGCDKSAKKKTIRIDGSSTVYPISEAVAEEWMRAGKGRVTIGVSGTGGGFQKFCNGETDVTGASRPIRPSEVKACARKGIEYIELPVARDGIVVAVHKDADWIDHITVDELRAIWRPEAQQLLIRWSQVRPGLPERELRLFGAGVDSGTYDYFTKVVVGTEHSSRGDFTSSEDDNVLVTGVSRDANALGFFGFAYYSENRDKVKALGVKGRLGEAVAPSVATITDGTYAPLSRPIFLYVTRNAADRSEVASFVDFLFQHGAPLVREVGFVPLPPAEFTRSKARFTQRTVGTAFGPSSTAKADSPGGHHP